MKVSVVIPVFNESATLPEIVARVRAVDVDQEIILVDDCSTDGSRSLIETFSHDDDIVGIYHETNQGKGAALWNRSKADAQMWSTARALSVGSHTGYSISGIPWETGY